LIGAKSEGDRGLFGQAKSDAVDESDLSGNITDEYVYFGGKRVAHRVVSSGSIYYYGEDYLGSSRVLTTSSGVVCYEADFDPYGGERVITNTCAQNYKFEGKERDSETQNDDFGARYYISRLCRWLSPDWSAVPAPVPYANLANPQTLNLYAMVGDNPETFADLDGHLLPAPIAGTGTSPLLQGNENALEAAYAAAVAATMDAAEVSASQAPQTPAQAQNQSQTQTQQNTAPANSRTDVVLYPRELPPTPQPGTGYLWEMDWKVGTCSGGSCTQSSANQNQTVSLVESQNGGPWKPTGDPSKGEAHDQISPEPKTFNQHWFVADPGGKPKQVQLVVGKDSKGNLIKTWEVHVEIKKTGDRPVYSPVP
jgi:RHS repeat-associated protein